jgi:hypothetical protein
VPLQQDFVASADACEGGKKEIHRRFLMMGSYFRQIIWSRTASFGGVHIISFNGAKKLCTAK